MEVCYIDWNVTPFRADRWFAIWEPAAARARSFGARSWSITRAEDNPLLFRQTSVWENRADFERYWFSDEIAAIREESLDYHGQPVLPAWYAYVGGEE